MDDFEEKLPDRAATLHGVGTDGERDAAKEANVRANPTPTRVPLATRGEKNWAIWKRPDGSTFRALGRVLETLELLARNGWLGVEAFDFPGGPPFRLGAYVHTLRKRHGLSIVTEREPHRGGWHARYVLHTEVSLADRGATQ